MCKSRFSHDAALILFRQQELLLQNPKGPIALAGYKFGVPVAMEMAAQLQTDELDLVKMVICLEGSHCYIPMEGPNHLHVEAFMEKEEQENHSDALFAFVDMYVGHSEEVRLL